MFYYEINVSLNGKHLFATAEHSITSRKQMEEVYKLFEEKFPEKDGYALDVTVWRKTGTPIILKNKHLNEA